MANWAVYLVIFCLLAASQAAPILKDTLDSDSTTGPGKVTKVSSPHLEHLKAGGKKQTQHRHNTDGSSQASCIPCILTLLPSG